MSNDLKTGEIKNWKSIITLVVFIITNIIVLYPFHISIYIPRVVWNAILDALSTLRIISPRSDSSQQSSDFEDHDDHHNGKLKPCVRFRFPMDFVTAPLIADLFLLALSAIGRQEVHDGTVGADNISPIDIMVFFLSLAYIAISIDASGLIRFLAFKVLQKGGKVGHRLFLYLYAFFFGLGSFIGNDPIILSGTAFLAYMTRVSSNIKHPRAWIHTQFAVANIASAILVSSNPTNLVLAGAFDIKFVHYTANMIVPVIITAIVLFPFLLYVIFAHEYYIPLSIEMHTLSEEAKARKPVNPNIPHARGTAEEQESDLTDSNQSKLLSLEEIMNPFLDKGGAAFGAIVMATTLITLLALNAASQSTHEHPVYWVTLPGAFVMFCWDVAFGWINRHKTRDLARKGREEIELARAERALREEDTRLAALEQEKRDAIATSQTPLTQSHSPETQQQNRTQSLTSETRDDTLATDNSGMRVLHLDNLIPPAPAVLEPENGDDKSQMSDGPAESQTSDNQLRDDHVPDGSPSTVAISTLDEGAQGDARNLQQELSERSLNGETDEEKMPSSGEAIYSARRRSRMVPLRPPRKKTTLVSLLVDWYRWSQETFPTVTAVVSHLPFKLVPFALSMFVLVQALVTKGWVPVFAYGWDHWVDKTGTVGAIGGMGFLSVILCNFAGTNIGTTILLSRVIQAWQKIHQVNQIPISDRTFWATVYSMALGVNYGAFSTAFSASLAGLLWRDILARKHIRVRRLDFARVNLPIIAVAMTVGCSVLIGEIYIMRNNSSYDGAVYNATNNSSSGS